MSTPVLATRAARWLYGIAARCWPTLATLDERGRRQGLFELAGLLYSYQIRLITYTLVGVWGRLRRPQISFSCAAPGKAGRRTRKHK